jgi:hypothetical protein
VTHLFTVLFFGLVLGASVAILWSVVDENLDKVMANLPWKSHARLPRRDIVVRKVDPTKRAYWTVPSISSDAPMRARTVSPAMAR